MNTDLKNTSMAFNAMSWLALAGGVVVYLMLGLFASVSLQKTVRDRIEGIPTSHIYYISCVAAFAISIVLLAIGLWNAGLMPSEKGFYAIAFFLSLFGAISVQKNVRDSQAEYDDSIQNKVNEKPLAEEE